MNIKLIIGAFMIGFASSLDRGHDWKFLLFLAIGITGMCLVISGVS